MWHRNQFNIRGSEQSCHDLSWMHYLVCRARSSADDPSEASKRWSSTQRREHRIVGEATSSGSSPLSGARLWLPTGPRTAPLAARCFYESPAASRTARRISPPPTPPPSPASSPVFPVSSSGVGWMCAAECGPLCTAGAVESGENKENGACCCFKMSKCLFLIAQL